MIKNEFKEKFIKIANKRWIKGVNNNTNSAGLTFEKLLNKEPDSTYFPNYRGLEIKTTTRFSRYPLKLFSISFDGTYLFETNRLVENYGKSDTIYKDKKILIGSINTNYPEKLTDYSFKIDVDYHDEKIYLCIYKNNILIERKSYIEFSTIIDRFNIKLSNLVVVYASKKKENEDLYLRYYAYKKYKLKKEINIIEYIEENIIKITFMCRIGRSNQESGKQKNKGIDFLINKEDIEKYMIA